MAKTIERNYKHAAKREKEGWNETNWSRVAQRVRRIQERIFRATRDGEWRKVKSLQKLLVRSLSARLLAVRRVTQENKGKNTAGIDGKIYIIPSSRMDLVEEIRNIDPNDYKPQPVRRVHIPKQGKQEKRPLGIPTIKDRCLQMIVKLALEPEWEAKFEPNSYGFRPGRRCMDAIAQIWKVIRVMPEKSTSAWILDADITKCFDTINHEALLKKIPVFKKIIYRWLKAGAIEFGKYYKTKTGTPQGGIISPLLANIALDGMERMFGIYTSNGNWISPSGRKGDNKGVSLVRYADDFVGMARSRESLINHVIPKLRGFLARMGMTLNSAKTRVVHRNEGFDFLSFNIRQFLGTGSDKCLARPSKGAIKRHCRHVKKILWSNKQATQADIIDKLNPVLRGWANYYRYSSAKRVFNYIDFRVFKMLWQWCKRRHKKENKGAKWIKRKYFRQIGKKNWVFADKDEHQLFYTRYMKVESRGYVKVKFCNSPFDASLKEYWTRRHGKPNSFTCL